MVKTGDLPLTDYSNTMFGLVGDGLIIDNVMHNWDVTAQIQAPAVNGNVYTWSFTDIGVSTAGGGFKIREGEDWSASSYGYNDVTLTGDGAAEFETNGDGNFIPLEDGATYNMTFTIDAETETLTMDMDRI
jgi:hypothetical protein